MFIKHYIIIFLGLLFFLGGKGNSNKDLVTTPISLGTYMGEFIYKSSMASDSGIVQLTFDKTSYLCCPIKSKHLLAGAGTYSFVDSTVVFTDTVAHIANSKLGDFLIRGEYSYRVNGKKIILTQNHEVAKILIKFELALKE
jgi:hypothetical protein